MPTYVAAVPDHDGEVACDGRAGVRPAIGRRGSGWNNDDPAYGGVSTDRRARHDARIETESDKGRRE